MIRLRGLTYRYLSGAPIFAAVDLDIPTDRKVAVLGHKASGKSSLIRLLAGITSPSSGRVERLCQPSFPGGFQGGFRLSHTGRQNIVYAARMYGADPKEVMDFVRKITGFGKVLDGPLRNLSLQDRVDLSYALVYALPFDSYLFDNTIEPAGTRLPEFQMRCRQLYAGRTQAAGAIVATRHARVAELLCDSAVVIRGDSLAWFDRVSDGVAVFAADAAAPGDAGDPATTSTGSQVSA